MLKNLQNISYSSEGKTVFNLWQILYILQKKHKVDFWDYYQSGSNFDNWCDSKGYGKKDPQGKRRGESNIWFKEWKKDIQNGNWKETPYCPFIDMFNYDIQDLGNDETDEIYYVDLNNMLERAIEEDKKEFGKNDYRYHLASILKKELGNFVYVDQLPE